MVCHFVLRNHVVRFFGSKDKDLDRWFATGPGEGTDGTSSIARSSTRTDAHGRARTDGSNARTQATQRSRSLTPFSFLHLLRESSSAYPINAGVASESALDLAIGNPAWKTNSPQSSRCHHVTACFLESRVALSQRTARCASVPRVPPIAVGPLSAMTSSEARACQQKARQLATAS